MTAPAFSTRSRLRASLFSFCALLAVLAAGCSSSKKLTQQEDCQAKWAKLHGKFDKKKYQDVKEPLNELITSCPGSNFTEEAFFDLAESYFSLKDWVEAESEYSSFFK